MSSPSEIPLRHLADTSPNTIFRYEPGNPKTPFLPAQPSSPSRASVISQPIAAMCGFLQGEFLWNLCGKTGKVLGAFLTERGYIGRCSGFRNCPDCEMGAVCEDSENKWPVFFNVIFRAGWGGANGGWDGAGMEGVLLSCT